MFSIRPHLVVDIFLYLLILITWVLVIYTGQHLAKKDLNLDMTVEAGTSQSIVGGIIDQMAGFIQYS